MYRIITKKILNPTVTLMEVEAPLIAKKAEPGQFIILRVDDEGERIPLTIADFDREKGTVTIIFQIVGGTTEKLNHSFDIVLCRPSPMSCASLGIAVCKFLYHNRIIEFGYVGAEIPYE